MLVLDGLLEQCWPLSDKILNRIIIRIIGYSIIRIFEYSNNMYKCSVRFGLDFIRLNNRFSRM